jgi:hypothetical protein
LIGACSLLFRPKDNTQLASGLKCKSLEIWCNYIAQHS